MQNCDALETDDLVGSACLLAMNSLFLLVPDNCESIQNSKPLSPPRFGPFVALSSVALYIRVSPLDLGHMSSSSFVLYRSQSLSPSPPHPEKALSCLPPTLYLSLPIIRTSFRESVTLSVKLFRSGDRGIGVRYPAACKRLRLLQRVQIDYGTYSAFSSIRNGGKSAEA